jgi:hypothetical protein
MVELDINIQSMIVYHIYGFSTIFFFDCKMSEAFEKQFLFVDNLSNEKKESLRLYTLDDDPYVYRQLNKYLKGHGPKPKGLAYKAMMDIESIFDEIDSLDEPTVLYRGIRKGDELDRLCYQSSTTELRVAEQFSNDMTGCCIFILTISPGVRLIPLKNVSEFKGEEEYLLDRDNHYIMTSQKSERGYTYKYLTVVPNNSREVIKDDGEVEEELNNSPLLSKSPFEVPQTPHKLPIKFTTKSPPKFQPSKPPPSKSPPKLQPSKFTKTPSKFTSKSTFAFQPSNPPPKKTPPKLM